MHALLIDGLDKVLCGMRRSPKIETWYEVLFLQKKVLQMQREY